MLRHRLTTLVMRGLEHAAAAVVQAGPGYGKSMGLVDVAAAWPHLAVRVELASARTPGLAELARAVVAALGGAARTDGGGDELGALLCGVERPLLLLVDDAHLLGDDTVAFADVLDRLPPRHRVVLSSRGDSDAVLHLATEHRAALFTAPDLAFTLAETSECLGRRHLAARKVQAATDGWPEGVALCATSPTVTMDGAGARGIVGVELRRRVPDDHAAATTALLRSSTAGASGDADRLLPALLAARLPLTRHADGSWDLAPALRRYLLSRRAPSRWRAADTASIGDAALRRAGHGVLDMLRAAELRGDAAGAATLLSRAATVFEDGPPDVRDAVEGERLRALIERGFTTQARLGAQALLQRCRGEGARARALEVLGRAARREGGEHQLLLAEDQLSSALALWRRLGERGRVDETRLRLAKVDLDLGRAPAALRRAQSLTRSPSAPPPVRAAAHLLWMQSLGDLGHSTGTEQDLAQAADEPETAATHGGVVLLRAFAALQRDDHADAARHLALHARAHPAERGAVRPARALFAAELWCRVGAKPRALAMAASARRCPAERSAAVRLGFAAIEARIGDPVRALAQFDELLHQQRVPPREIWRVHLLRAMAAARDGRSPAPALDQALRAATAIGQPSAPYVRERELLADVLDMPGVWRSGEPA